MRHEMAQPPSDGVAHHCPTHPAADDETDLCRIARLGCRRHQLVDDEGRAS